MLFGFFTFEELTDIELNLDLGLVIYELIKYLCLRDDGGRLSLF